MLHDQRELVELAMERCDYIHARFGHEQGPQINDPRCPWNESEIARHFYWWDHILELNKSRGVKKIYMSRVWTGTLYVNFTTK